VAALVPRIWSKLQAAATSCAENWVSRDSPELPEVISEKSLYLYPETPNHRLQLARTALQRACCMTNLICMMAAIDLFTGTATAGCGDVLVGVDW
jgi:hypothetical protein